MTAHRPAPDLFLVRLGPGQANFEAPADQSLLLAAALAGIELPSSCRNGICRACICRLLEGEIAYQVDWPGVLPEERAQGFILPCVACARSDLVLDCLQ